MNLDLNFVNNMDVRLGNYETALKAFNNVIRIKPDHAFAYYFAAKCYKGLGNELKYIEYMQSFDKFSSIPFWSEYVKYFSLEHQSAPMIGI